ncbi:MAG: plasmid stability protein [Cyanobacteria bacterium]|nr:plasmid stability protein [Cyanobacteriota bacterium]
MDPDALHARLAAAARRHRRSLNNEAIVCLEAGLGATPGSVEQQLAEIRALRQSLGTQSFDPAIGSSSQRPSR